MNTPSPEQIEQARKELQSIHEDLELFFEEHVPCECEPEHGITCQWCSDTGKLLDRISAIHAAAHVQAQAAPVADGEKERSGPSVEEVIDILPNNLAVGDYQRVRDLFNTYTEARSK